MPWGAATTDGELMIEKMAVGVVAVVLVGGFVLAAVLLIWMRDD